MPISWLFTSAYSATGTFTAPVSGWYRVHCIGGSGDGGNVIDYANSSVDVRNIGSGGGGSGAVAISEVYLLQGVTYSFVISDKTVTFMGMRAGRGQDGEWRYGGKGGIATGGNIGNYNGFDGGQSSDENNYGGNSGMQNGRDGYQGATSGTVGRGAGGGARLPANGICPYVVDTTVSMGRAARGGSGSTPTNGSNSTVLPVPTFDANLKLYGGGGGRAGDGHSSSGGARSIGSPAAIVFERGIY